MYSKGDRVAQSQYGAGTIVETNERQTIVEFDDYGLKAFSTRLVLLVRTAIAPPTPSHPARTRRGTRARASRGTEQR
jgi:hypothetical protein